MQTGISRQAVSVAHGGPGPGFRTRPRIVEYMLYRLTVGSIPGSAGNCSGWWVPAPVAHLMLDACWQYGSVLKRGRDQRLDQRDAVLSST